MTEARRDAALMPAIERVARFLETRDDTHLSAFAARDVAILENFAPFLFAGPDAVARWAAAMRVHLHAITDLEHRFGPPQDVSVGADLAYLSLPTHWTGVVGGRPFDEDGGWAFVLVREGEEWRVRNYGWAVTRMGFSDV
jgi:hypothetical protein